MRRELNFAKTTKKKVSTKKSHGKLMDGSCRRPDRRVIAVVDDRSGHALNTDSKEGAALTRSVRQRATGGLKRIQNGNFDQGKSLVTFL